MKLVLMLSLFLLGASFADAQTPRRVTGEGIAGGLWRYENFASRYVPARHVDVWLPADYAKTKKYAVLYMHDGQMLFDAATTWNKQEWGIDETMTRLLAEKKIRDAIVVGIWNTPRRREEYMPQKAFAMASEEQKKLAAQFEIGAVASDDYLKFIVEELKPFIDKTYATRAGRADTFVMGSSMGGLVSLYAISEYPQVFGGAGCLSTHFPAGDGVVIEYMKKHLPGPKGMKIYFDYGTETLDASYEPYQSKADEVMKAKGYRAGRDWLTRKFPGEDHSEKAWAKRVEIPLVFLLGQ